MKKHIRKEIKRQLKKTLRTSGRQIRLKEDNFVAVFNRNMYAKTDMRGFLQGIDRLMESGHVLKNRPTSFISRVAIKDRNVVIKRYNHKSLFHSIRQSLQRSRARRSWLHGHRLSMLCVNTPRPLAYIEKRIGPILWASYIITQDVEGPNLEDVVNDPNTSDNHKQPSTGSGRELVERQIQQKINDLMRKLHENFITHGDFKRTNFIVSGGEPYVTDLDSMRVHIPGILFKHRQKKDVNRLKRMFTQTSKSAH
jgi:tRNA A-37 threonylcarbamoyl transferase component Bud32